MLDKGLLVMTAYALKEYIGSGEYAKPFKAEEIANMVIAHAAAAAVAAMAAGILPGAAAIIAGGIAVAAIWSMYYRIGKYIGIGFSLDTLKALAAALISNLVTQIGGVLALDILLTFVPGASIIAGGLMNFAIVYVAGLIYLNMLVGLFKAGLDPSNLNAEELKKAYSKTSEDVDIKAACAEAKSMFTEMRKSGELKKKADEGKPIE